MPNLCAFLIIDDALGVLLLFQSKAMFEVDNYDQKFCSSLGKIYRMLFVSFITNHVITDGSNC